MGERLPTREAQAIEVIDRLADRYPDPDISLEFSNRLELLVAVILSAQCTDERVNEVTEELFEKYRSAEDYAEADVDELADNLYSITYHNQKAGYLTDACQQIVDEHDGAVPDTMSALTDLAGVGRKTANVVLQHGHDVVEGVVVDTHVTRLSQRLGLTESDDPTTIESEMIDIVPQDEWREFTHWLIAHGRDTCTARSPSCEACILEDICPSSREDSSVDLATGDPW